MPRQGRVYIARETGSAEVDGQSLVFIKGVTRVREGHPLLKGREAYFELAEDFVHYDIEAATAAPGERRA